MRFFLIHATHLSDRVQCSHRVTSATWTIMSSDTTIYHERHLSGRVQCNHRARYRREQSWDKAIPSTSYCMSSHYTAICWWIWVLEVHHFDNNGFRSRETVNIVSIIVEYGDQSDIYLWKVTNSLAILRLSKPQKTSTRLAGDGIWTRVLPNASLVCYHGATSLGCIIFWHLLCLFISPLHLGSAL